MTGIGLNRSWFVPFLLLVLNMTGFDHDSENESNGFACIPVLTVSWFLKKMPSRSLALIALPCFYFYGYHLIYFCKFPKLRGREEGDGS